MSLNWKEINRALEEMDLPGSQIQKIVQSSFDTLCLQVYNHGTARSLLIVIAGGVCRFHQTFLTAPRYEKPLRFAEFFKSRLCNAYIRAAEQLGDNRIVRLLVARGAECFRVYIRLWSGAANVIVTDGEGVILDAMRRLPKRGEITGGVYTPEAFLLTGAPHECEVRTFGVVEEGEEDFSQGTREKEGNDSTHSPYKKSFSERVDAWYAASGGALSLDALREQAKRSRTARIARMNAALQQVEQKAASFEMAERYKEYADIIMAADHAQTDGQAWLEADDFYRGGRVRISLDARKSAVENAQEYYKRCHKAKSGLAAVSAEAASLRAAIEEQERTLEGLLAQESPLELARMLRQRPGAFNGPDRVVAAAAASARKRPGLSFMRDGWLLIVGRDVKENDDLLRHHVKGGDMWLHARDVSGAYVFIKQKARKSYPLDILLDAGNLAVFYSKARNAGKASLFYTPVKYLRRVKRASRLGGPTGKVIPAHEKNLDIVLDEQRLAVLERCRV
jgi:predicted ribosome quality control (RQC) complex YloA/Tae2 family protein